MAYFIELTSNNGSKPVMINVDCIIYIDSANDGARIHFVCSDEKVIYVKESYQVVKRKINEL